jgi:hypothetical protein
MHYKYYRSPREKKGIARARLATLDPTVGQLRHWELVRVVGRADSMFHEQGKGKAKSGES